MPDSSYIFQKYRNADDAPGDLAWCNKQADKALLLTKDQTLQSQISGLDLNTNERALISLLKLPRSISDLIDCELMNQDELRCVLRSLHAAELVELTSQDKARALVPIEIKRARAAASGKTASPGADKKRKKKRLQPRVYRPPVQGIDNDPHDDPQAFVPKGPITGDGAVPVAPPEAVAQAMSKDDEAFEKELADVAKRLKNTNYFETLGLLSDADDAAIKKAYFERAKRYHPDALAGHRFQDPELAHKRVKAIFAKIGEAYETLQNAERRKDYRQRVEAGIETQQDDSRRRRRPGEAHLQFKKASALLQKKDYGQARRMFTIAAELDHEDPIYPSYAAWCHFFDSSIDKEKRSRQAVQQLQDWLQKKPHAQTAYFLGMIFKLSDRQREAVKMFNQALEIDPLHSESSRELRVIELRQQHEAERKEKAKSAGGFLDKLLKR